MTCPADINSIFTLQKQNGGPFWSREDGDIHAPNGTSTIDTLNVLGILGAKEKQYPILSEAVNFIFNYQTPEGSFKYSKTSSKLPCMTARILTALGGLGYATDKRTEISYQNLLENQWTDGGWRCNTVKLGKSPQTDSSNPGTTLYVLDAFRFRQNHPKERLQLDKGAEFLLQHWATKKPLGPCDFGIGSRFLQVEFPFLRYNLFYYVYVLSFYKKVYDDERFNQAYNVLKSKLKDGNVLLENPHRSWRKYDFAKKGKISNLATTYWNIIENNVRSKISDAT